MWETVKRDNCCTTIEEHEDREKPNEYKKKKKNERKIQSTQKQLHGQFIKQTMGKTSEDWCGWLRKGCLKQQLKS